LSDDTNNEGFCDTLTSFPTSAATLQRPTELPSARSTNLMQIISRRNTNVNTANTHRNINSGIGTDINHSQYDCSLTSDIFSPPNREERLNCNPR
jgi:hypothetical protein